MLRSTGQEEFLLPENYFAEMVEEVVFRARMANSPEEMFETPPGYFEDSAARILSGIDAEASQADEPFFHEQRASILAQVSIASAAGGEEFEVPADFFGQQRTAITQKTIGRRIRSINWRTWSTVAAAALVIFAIMILWPSNREVQFPAFSYIIDKVDLDEDDMEYFASEDDYYEFYLSEVDMEEDTIIDDYIQEETIDTTVAGGPAQLDPNTGLPIKKEQGDVKPSGGKNTPTFDELTEEEILRYLLEEGDNDLMDGIN